MRAKGALVSDRPGREIPAEYREVVRFQVEELGWRYDSASGRSGHPRLLPRDHTKQPVTVPGSPSDPRSFRNFLAQVRRSGGRWPRT